MTSTITELFLRLPPQGKQALVEGQLEIADEVDGMPRRSPYDLIRRFNHWAVRNLKLISALEELHPKVNGNSND